MSRIAVIGAGISGMAAAYYLSRKHEVWLFERDARLGGHTHTVTVDSSQGPLPVDTGFIVHNERTYPNFCSLMRELGVETQASDMSFAVTTHPDSKNRSFEYSSHGLPGFFAQLSNIFRPGHYTLLREILRFNREAPKLLEDPSSTELTMAQFLEAGRYDPQFVSRYLYPMASAVWSMPMEEMGEFPALTLVRFFENHGMLGINTHPQWKTIRGGSQAYIAPLTAPYKERIQLNAVIQNVIRKLQGIEIQFAGEPARLFDEVVFSCHGDQVLDLLPHPTDQERDVLGTFRTTRNSTCLHTDERLLPGRKAARASWNYLLGDNGTVAVTYHMNRLQSLTTSEQYCVTLNADNIIAKDRVIKQMVYEHPVYNKATIRAQQRWSEISGHHNTHFCGAYWSYGFHEDGVRSAIRVAETLGVRVA